MAKFTKVKFTKGQVIREMLREADAIEIDGCLIETRNFMRADDEDDDGITEGTGTGDAEFSAQADEKLWWTWKFSAASLEEAEVKATEILIADQDGKICSVEVMVMTPVNTIIAFAKVEDSLESYSGGEDDDV